MRTKRSRRELCTQASSLMRLCRPAPLITATGTHVSHCTRIHIRRVLRTLSSPHTLFSVSLSLALSRFGLKHFFRNCIVNNVVLILESAMFPVFMGLMLLFIGPQCCIRPRLAPYYGSCVVRVSLALAGGTFSCCPWYLIRKCISLGFPLFFWGAYAIPHIAPCLYCIWQCWQIKFSLNFFSEVFKLNNIMGPTW